MTGWAKRNEIIGMAARWFDALAPTLTRDAHCQEWWVGCRDADDDALAHAVAAWWMHPAPVVAGRCGDAAPKTPAAIDDIAKWWWTTYAPVCLDDEHDGFDAYSCALGFFLGRGHILDDARTIASALPVVDRVTPDP